MARLSELLCDVPVFEQIGPSDLAIRHIQFDSRRIGEGDLFVAVPGTQVDGHDFIPKAITQQPPAKAGGLSVTD